jgi:hypothetical protein
MNLVLKALTLATETIKLLVALKEIGLEKNRDVKLDVKMAMA